MRAYSTPAVPGRTFTPAGAAPAITTSSPLPGGNVGAAYSQALAASGGTAPLVWSVLSGSVPAGCSLSAVGVLSGTPTTAAAYTFVAKVRDNVGRTATKSFDCTIAASLIWTTQPFAWNGLGWGGTAGGSWTYGTTFKVVQGKGCRCAGVAFLWATNTNRTFRFSLWNITLGTRLSYVDLVSTGASGEGVMKSYLFATPYIFPDSDDVYAVSCWEMTGAVYADTTSAARAPGLRGTAYNYLASVNYGGGDGIPTLTTGTRRYTVDAILQVPG